VRSLGPVYSVSMKYCSACGGEVQLTTPEDDNRERHVCKSCDCIHYINPRIIVGCLPIRGGQVLLCKRAIEPRLGYWTLPAGFMENGESCEAGAARETLEETQAIVSSGQLQSCVSIPYINQVYMLFMAELGDAPFGPTPESTEVALFSEEEIPWEQLAFPVMKFALERYFEDRKSGNFKTHQHVIEFRPSRQRVG
jgi:ADP-ribose pyrophosphatase YjhB (NUDIX family)